MKKHLLSAAFLMGLGAATVQAQAPDSQDRLQLRNQHIATAQTYNGVADIEVGSGFDIEQKIKVELKGCNSIVFTEGFKIEPGAELVATIDGDCLQEASAETAETAKSADTEPAVRPTMAPNPFIGSVHLRVTLKEAGLVSLRIFDMQGTQIAVPIEGIDLGSGAHEIPIDLPGISYGTYVYQATVAGEVFTGKLIRLP